MAKFSISIPDELAGDLRDAAGDNVSAFVSAAVRHELDRRRLFAFLGELEGELGPPDEDEVAAFSAEFSRTAATKPVPGGEPVPSDAAGGSGKPAEAASPVPHTRPAS